MIFCHGSGWFRKDSVGFRVDSGWFRKVPGGFRVLHTPVKQALSSGNGRNKRNSLANIKWWAAILQSIRSSIRLCYKDLHSREVIITILSPASRPAVVGYRVSYLFRSSSLRSNERKSFSFYRSIKQTKPQVWEDRKRTQAQLLMEIVNKKYSVSTSGT